MKGMSLPEMLIVLVLVSVSALLGFASFNNFYETRTVKAFTTQIMAAIKLAQALSLTRNENLTICAEKQGQCQIDWQGNLVLLSKNDKLIRSFGTTPANLTITYSGFYRQDLLLIQNHGLLMNNGTFTMTGHRGHAYNFVINQQGT
jgi:prepilin-type N-terminal cleavage/methylation domain-containing protein